MNGRGAVIRLSFCFLILLETAQAQRDSLVTFSEIMFNPVAGNNEFIELYNRSATDSIDIANFKINYYTSNSDGLLATGSGTKIPPNGFALIFEGDYDLAGGVYASLVPSSALILKISDNAFGTTGMANTTNRAVRLLSSAGDTLETYFYSANNGTGISDEKKILINDSSSGNWSNSLNANGTPGFKNSVTPLFFDLAVSSISTSPSFPTADSSITISSVLKNAGSSAVQNFSVEMFLDTNKNAVGNLSEKFYEQLLSLNSNDSATISAQLLNLPVGNYQVIVSIILLADENQTNNTKSAEFTVYPKPNSFNDVVINEIMYAPVSGEPEWVEVFNASNETINLKDWTINDVYTTPAYGKVTGDFILLPQTFGVLAKDSSITNYHRTLPSKFTKVNLPVLNNDVDGVVLKDNRAVIMDSVLYSSSWGGANGFSLERKMLTAPTNSQDNWGSSFDVEQSTPGRINSQTPKEYDLIITSLGTDYSSFGENENFPIYALIKNIGSKAVDNFSVNFYVDTDSNRTADELFASQLYAANLQSGDSVKVFSGNNRAIAKKTLFAAKILFANDADTLNNEVEKYFEPGYRRQAVLINEVMYNPNDNAPEWIELLAKDSLNLKNWSLADSLSTPTKVKISYNDFTLFPNELVVLAKDSASFFTAYHPSARIKFIAVNLPSLSNTEDGIQVYDFRDALIDGMRYKSSWAGKKGFSIERIADAGDSLSWITSLAVNGNSAGEENLLPNQNAARNSIVINEIMFDPDVDNSEFIEFQNISGETINVGGWCIQDEKGNFYKLSETGVPLAANEFFVLAADSTILLKYSGLSSSAKISIANEPSLGLSNTGKLVRLTNIFGTSIDSVFYSEKWHNKNIINTKNKSLERINPTLDGNLSANWSTSVSESGATPGNQNSIFTTNNNTSANISVSPNPFSPDGNGVEDFTIITYNLSQPISQTRIKIFDAKGRIVRTLTNNQESAQSGSVIFNGLDDDGNPLRIGIYIVYLEAMNDASAVVDKLKTVVVVARKL